MVKGGRMTITPNPDPTSRYPNEYCLTCGQGWPEYVKCQKRQFSDKGEWSGTNPGACNFSGSVPFSDKMRAIAEAFARGDCEAGTRTLSSGVDWSKFNPPNDSVDWGNLKEHKP